MAKSVSSILRNMGYIGIHRLLLYENYCEKLHVLYVSSE